MGNGPRPGNDPVPAMELARDLGVSRFTAIQTPFHRHFKRSDRDSPRAIPGTLRQPGHRVCAAAGTRDPDIATQVSRVIHSLVPE